MASSFGLAGKAQSSRTHGRPISSPGLHARCRGAKYRLKRQLVHFAHKNERRSGSAYFAALRLKLPPHGPEPVRGVAREVLPYVHDRQTEAAHHRMRHVSVDLEREVGRVAAKVSLRIHEINLASLDGDQVGNPAPESFRFTGYQGGPHFFASVIVGEQALPPRMDGPSVGMQSFGGRALVRLADVQAAFSAHRVITTRSR